jgi:tetratricopeptide (TPR) repeat protein
MECYEKALALKPNLVESHLCKGTILLVALNKPAEACLCFETAYKFDPALDQKWNHVYYWYGATLFALGRPADALAQVETGLSLAPDNPYLLNQKAALLSTSLAF